MNAILKALGAGASELFMGPILLKEVRGTFRTRRFFLAQLIPMLLIGAVVMIVAIVMSADPGVRLNPERIGELIYAFFFIVQSGLLMLIIPAFSCTSITEERERRTFDLLITSSLKPWEIVWGKVLAAMAYVLVFLLSSLPLVFVSFLFGGVSPGMLALCYIILFVLGTVTTVFAVFCSSLVHSTKVATVVAYVPIIAAASCIIPMLIGLVVMLLERGWADFVTDVVGDRFINQLMAAFVIPVYTVASLCIFLFLLAVNRIRPATGNRSTSIRIFTTVFLAFGAAVYATMIWLNRVNIGATDLIWGQLGYFIPVSVLLLFTTLAFPCEELDRSERLRRKMAWMRRFWFPLRLFGTGAISGALFNLLLSAAALAVPVVLVAFVAATQPDTNLKRYTEGLLAVSLTAVAAWVFLYFTTMLGLLLSTLNLRALAVRCIVFFIVTLLTFGPFFHVIWMYSMHDQNRPTLLSCQYLSPIVGWFSIWTDRPHDAFGSTQYLHLTYGGVGLVRIHYVHIVAYMFLGAVLAVVNAIRAPRVKARLEKGPAVERGPVTVPD